MISVACECKTNLKIKPSTGPLHGRVGQDSMIIGSHLPHNAIPPALAFVWRQATKTLTPQQCYKRRALHPWPCLKQMPHDRWPCHSAFCDWGRVSNFNDMYVLPFSYTNRTQFIFNTVPPLMTALVEDGEINGRNVLLKIILAGNGKTTPIAMQSLSHSSRFSSPSVSCKRRTSYLRFGASSEVDSKTGLLVTGFTCMSLFFF